ncbi:MAG: response regulator [Bacteroidetes bacterium]|nr:response regulator [Bacteroidota bacterium]
MLVDDNPLDNLINSQLIETAGFALKINKHESAKETLDFLKNATPEELPEVIFLDIIMPVMDGFQFLEEFEKLGETITKKCKIILLSTSDSFKDLNRANKNRLVKKFLNKPLTVEMLSAINI